MSVHLRILIICATTVVGFLLGYSISSSSGVEPGFHEAAEAGAYGSVEEPVTTEGLSKEEQEYYESLTK